MTPSLFTREEAATILKISVPSLDLYTKTSQLNPIYLGSRVLYEEKELNRFIRAMKKQPRGCRGPKMPDEVKAVTKKEFTDSFGNTQDVSRGTALGPLPEAMPTESEAKPKLKLESVWNMPKAKDEDWRTKKADPPSGYSNPVDDPEFLRRFWGHP